MSSRILCTMACALALNADALAASPAQTGSLQIDLASVNAHEFVSAPMTVLVMAPNGSWGAATSDPLGVATAAAIAHCNRMYRKGAGCGAYSTTIRGCLFRCLSPLVATG